MKELGYKNEGFEAQVKSELTDCFAAAQKLLDCWNSLDIGVLKESLWILATRTPEIYKKAVEAVTEKTVSLGRYPIKSGVLLDMLEIPIPNELYIAARNAKKQPMFGHPELWDHDGKRVMLDKAKADALIHVNDIWITNERQREFLKYCLQFMESSNWLHVNLIPLPGMMSKFGPPFNLVARSAMFINSYTLEPVQLKMLIDSIE